MRTILIALAASAALACPALAAQQQGQSQPTQQTKTSDFATHGRIARDLDRTQIRMLQQALEQKGCNAGVPDGIWRGQTTRAVRDFQITRAMPHHGLDLKTVAALGLNPAQFAMNKAPATASTVGYGGQASAGGGDTNLNAFHNAKMGVLDATAAVTMDGSQVLDVRFGMHDGQPVYFVRTYNGARKSFWEGMVDANSGKIIGKGQTTPQNELAQQDKTELQGLNNAKWSLEDAVNSVEQHTKGNAVDAWLVQSKGRTAYEVRIDQNGKTQNWRFDPATGQVSAV
jgi:uncharacterized membrane protein YkoI